MGTAKHYIRDIRESFMEEVQINLAFKVHRLHMTKNRYQISETLRARANRKGNIHGAITEE